MPLIVSPSLVANTSADELADRLKRPHIGWHNVLTHQSVQCPAELKDPLTWNRWRGQPIIRNDILIDRSSVAAAGAINYLGIASHNLGTVGRTVSIGHYSEEKLADEDLARNGGFDSDITGWATFTNNTTAEWAAGEFKATRVAVPTTDAALCGQAQAFKAGALYRVSFDCYSPDYAGQIRVCHSPGNTYTDDAAVTSVTNTKTRRSVLVHGRTDGVNLLFLAGGSVMQIGESVYFDNITIHEVIRPEGWFTLASFTPTTDDAIMVIFEDETTPPPGHFDQWQVSIASGSSVAPEIGAMSMGRVLVMPHCIYGGHSPATLSRETEIEPNVSIGGRFLGRSIIRRGYRTNYEFRHLPAQWYREHFDPFVEHALRDPFFIAWKPDKFPAEVLYGWTTGDIRPVNMGVRDLMSVSFGVEGYR